MMVLMTLAVGCIVLAVLWPYESSGYKIRTVLLVAALLMMAYLLYAAAFSSALPRQPLLELIGWEEPAYS